LLPEPVVTTVPPFAPFFTGDVVILVPFLKFFEFEMIPTMDPLGFWVHLERTGTLPFGAGAAFLTAAFLTGAFLTGAFLEVTGFFLTGAFLTGVAGFGLEAPPPKRENACFF